ncbi:MCE family protein [Halioglobus maricola]|uniref:MCE family protein n=1 Tax=Halioglobus maricola TaxID=2601894 RepID=A0A5P9NIY5_9GAMM|nr:MlaD family protein [Halioglobus maricola]QFU74918.1 MCE family protein [Halioglobus maricola]
MSEQSNTVAIGAFVTGALVIAITTVIFALGTGFGSERSKVVMVFEGSVKGLTLGAPVALRGVQVGQVTDIELILDTETVDLIMLVEAEIRSENVRRSGASTESLTEELISRGLRAQLNTQSLLTGLLYIQLDFHPNSEINLADVDTPYLQIPTIPTELERLTRKLETIDFAKVAGDLEAVAAGINSFVSSEGFQGLPQQAQDTLASLTALSERLSAQVDSSGPRIDQLLDGANTTINTANRELPEMAELVKSNLALLEAAISAFESGMSELEALLDQDSATIYELNRTLRDLSQAGRSLQQLSRTLEEQPEALLRGRTGDQK